MDSLAQPISAPDVPRPLWNFLRVRHKENRLNACRNQDMIQSHIHMAVLYYRSPCVTIWYMYNVYIYPALTTLACLGTALRAGIPVACCCTTNWSCIFSRGRMYYNNLFDNYYPRSTSLHRFTHSPHPARMRLSLRHLRVALANELTTARRFRSSSRFGKMTRSESMGTTLASAQS